MPVDGKPFYLKIFASAYLDVFVSSPKTNTAPSAWIRTSLSEFRPIVLCGGEPSPPAPITRRVPGFLRPVINRGGRKRPCCHANCCAVPRIGSIYYFHIFRVRAGRYRTPSRQHRRLCHIPKAPDDAGSLSCGSSPLRRRDRSAGTLNTGAERDNDRHEERREYTAYFFLRKIYMPKYTTQQKKSQQKRDRPKAVPHCKIALLIFL